MRCRRSSAAVSSKVRSGCSVITATTRSACCSSGETLPPRGFGAALLLSLQRCIHLTTELTLTPKCSAASCRDAPASTISIARSRKSQEYDFGIVTPRVRESMLKQSPIHDRLGIPRFKSAGSRFSYSPLQNKISIDYMKQAGLTAVAMEPIDVPFDQVAQISVEQLYVHVKKL